MTTHIKDRIFETINSVLYVFEKALTEAGLSTNYYRKERSSGNKRLSFLCHPLDKRYSLVAFETLSDDHKEKIKVRFGNPYDFVVREPIRAMIEKNKAVLQSLLSYEYGGGKKLPIYRVKQYSRACDILDLLLRVDESRNKAIKDLGISTPQFYEHLKYIIQEEQRNGESDSFEGYNQLYTRFPFHYVSLRDKMKEYKDKGFSCVIDKAYGNEAALKIRHNDAKDFLISLFKNPLQYNDVLICMLYNTEAANQGWKTIAPSTVQNWRKEYAAEITPHREGSAAFNEKYIRQVKGMRPSAPLFLVEHDDNNLDWLYQDKEGGQFNRYVAIVVTDSHCDLVLGKSVILGHDPETWQVQHAYIDAMYYIRSLTGGWHMPHEFKADKWRSKSLAPLYSKIAKFVPPSHGNKHRGYIEQFFGSHFWKNCQKLVTTNNWNGNNLTAKNRGFSPDMLELSFKSKSRPMIGDEAELQIEQFFYLLRNMSDFKRTDMNAPSKEQKWLQSWNELSIEKRNPITDEQFLLTFGVTHQPRHTDTIRITNRGVEPQICNSKYSYDLPESWMYSKLRGAEVQVIYDPFDMSRILVTNNDDIRFTAKSAQLVPRALKDHYTGSRTFLNSILEEKRDQVKQVAEKSASRKQFSRNHAEAILQSGSVMPKELKNSVEQGLIDENFTKEIEEFIDSNNDLDEFYK
jgi:hypothetical protein